jgi:hypothetical protein
VEINGKKLMKMQQELMLPQQYDFAYENVIGKCFKELICSSGMYSLINNLQLTNRSVSYSLLLVPFSGLSREIQYAQKLFNDRKYVDVVKSVDNFLFNSFGSLSKLLNSSLQDKTEIPNVVSGLKEAKFIEERTAISILDALLILDGLTSQVNQGEPLSRKDLALLTSALKIFQKINVIIGATSPSQTFFENWVSTNYYSISQISIGGSLHSAYNYTTFSTSSNTLTQSSITVFIK